MHQPRTVITIGNFDGVHVGHAALVRRCVERANQHSPRLRIVALSFDPHPQSVLRPDLPPPARLTHFEQRREYLIALGADEVHRLTPTQQLLSMSPDEFISTLIADYAPEAVVEGRDFHFGHQRSGSIDTLRLLGTRFNFAVDTVPSVEAALSDDLLVPASSSMVRWLLSHGRARDAAIVIGRAYELRGAVVQGDQRGRTIGFPTANLSTQLHVPAEGVYAGLAILPDSLTFPAAINIGTRPTFAGQERRVEAHLIGTQPGEIPGEYGWPLRLQVHHWLRDQVKFDSVPRLVEQIKRDCRRTLELVHGPALASTITTGNPELASAHDRSQPAYRATDP